MKGWSLFISPPGMRSPRTCQRPSITWRRTQHGRHDFHFIFITNTLENIFIKRSKKSVVVKENCSLKREHNKVMNYQKKVFLLQKEWAITTFTKVLVQNGSIFHARLLVGGSVWLLCLANWLSNLKGKWNDTYAATLSSCPPSSPKYTLPNPSQLDYLKGNSRKSYTPKYSLWSYLDDGIRGDFHILLHFCHK